MNYNHPIFIIIGLKNLLVSSEMHEHHSSLVKFLILTPIIPISHNFLNPVSLYLPLSITLRFNVLK